jgi:CubicO group peptidase (beta-lactamase class C family)
VPSLPEVVDELAAQTGFSGVVSVHRSGQPEFARAYGYAHRGHQVPNTVGTRFAIASGAKGFTALTVVRLVARGVLRMSTTARSVLGDDLPLIGDGVTVEHLLAHRSGIGDYFDEDAGHDVSDHVLPVPVHTLLTTEQYLAVLAGIRPGSRPVSASPTATAATWCSR